MNLCDACREDFGSLSAFDAHRVGKHAYTLIEGLRFEPPVEDGRRCLATWELEASGWRRDSQTRWRTPGQHPVAAVFAARTTLSRVASAEVDSDAA